MIDKDHTSELLARELDPDPFVMATDADAVYLDWNTPQQRGIRSATREAMRQFDFPAGSMGPKVDAARQFAELTGNSAAIGALADLAEIATGAAGTTIRMDASEIAYHLSVQVTFLANK